MDIRAIIDWFNGSGRFIIERGSDVLIVAVLTFVLMRILRVVVQRFVRGVSARQGGTRREAQQKAQTLGSAVESTGRLVIIIVASVMIIGALGLNIGPLIASAGIAGIAIGLGAQSLIRDMVNGFFILMENQYAVGDSVTIGAFTGSVEEVSLRRTVLRSVRGEMIVIPNGTITAVQNASKGWSRAVIDVDTAPTANDQQVIALLREVVAELQADPVLGKAIVEEPQVLGVTATSASAVTFRLLIKTPPLQQWNMEREARMRVRLRLQEAGVPLPLLPGGSSSPGA